MDLDSGQRYYRNTAGHALSAVNHTKMNINRPDPSDPHPPDLNLALSRPRRSNATLEEILEREELGNLFAGGGEKYN